MIRIYVDPVADAQLRNFGNLPGLGQAIARGMDRENELTLQTVRRKLSGQVLNRRTGRLRDSMQRTDALVTGQGDSLMVRSSIGSNVRTGGQSVVYAGIHEHGGQTRPHVIRAKNKAALSFSWNGRTITVKSVKHPGSKIPARPYLRPSIEERESNYKATISAEIIAFYKTVGGVR